MVPRIVASYTTLPSRYEVLQKSISTLKNQTIQPDAIYVTLPKKARRLNQEYPEPPQSLTSLCTIVRSEIDYGPITKLYGALIKETDPDTIIISCDDDVGFPPNLIETLLAHHKDHPKAAICGTGVLLKHGWFFMSIVYSVAPFSQWKHFTGFPIPKSGRNVDLVFGSAGVLYTRDMFPSKENLEKELFRYSLEDSDLFHNDDILISGYLCRQGIKRRIFDDIPEITHFSGSDALSSDFFKMWNRMQVAYTKAQGQDMFQETEDSSMAETPAARTAILVLFLIIVIWYAIQNWVDHSYSAKISSLVDF